MCCIQSWNNKKAWIVLNLVEEKFCKFVKVLVTQQPLKTHDLFREAGEIVITSSHWNGVLAGICCYWQWLDLKSTSKRLGVVHTLWSLHSGTHVDTRSEQPLCEKIVCKCEWEWIYCMWLGRLLTGLCSLSLFSWPLVVNAVLDLIKSITPLLRKWRSVWGLNAYRVMWHAFFFLSVSSDIARSQKRSARKHCVKCKGFLYGWPACKICLLTHSSSPCLLSHAALSSYNIFQLVILNIHRWLHVGHSSRFLHPSLLSPFFTLSSQTRRHVVSPQ